MFLNTTRSFVGRYRNTVLDTPQKKTMQPPKTCRRLISFPPVRVFRTMCGRGWRRYGAYAKWVKWGTITGWIVVGILWASPNTTGRSGGKRTKADSGREETTPTITRASVWLGRKGPVVLLLLLLIRLVQPHRRRKQRTPDPTEETVPKSAAMTMTVIMKKTLQQQQKPD
jgi:hypothetical protein